MLPPIDTWPYHFCLGDWSLSISPVEFEDEAEFQCQVGGAEGQNPIR